MNKEIIRLWLEKAYDIEPGESIYLAAETRALARFLCTEIRGELRIMAEIEPLKASKLSVGTMISDGMYWACIKRSFGSPLVGFKKTMDGGSVRMTLEDPERRRRLNLMKADGMTLAEVEETELDLTEEERSMFE